MVHLTRIIGIIILVYINHTTSNSDSQNNQNQGKPLDSPNNNVNPHNDIKSPDHDESQSNDKLYDTNSKSHDNNINFNQQDIIESRYDSPNDEHEPQATFSELDDTLVFEEEGDEDELLVEQMKRLSEKIKKGNEGGKREMNQGGNAGIRKEEDVKGMSDTGVPNEQEMSEINSEQKQKQQKVLIDIPDIAQKEETEFTEQIELIKEPQKEENKVQTPEEHVIINSPGMKQPITEFHHEDVAQSRNEEKTLTEQMKENIENMRLPDIGPPPDDDNFPDDVTHDINQPSVYLEPSTAVPISNTLPPIQDAHSQTPVLRRTGEKTVSMANGMTADEMVVSSTPTLNAMTERNKHTVQQTEIKATATTPTEEQSSAFLGIKNKGKNFRMQKKAGVKVDATEDSKERKQYAELPQTIDQTATILDVQGTDIYPTKNDKTLKHTATILDSNQMTERPIDTSDNLPEGTVLETATAFKGKDAAKVIAKNVGDKVVPNTATIATSNEDTEVPAMTQILTQDGPGSESPSSQTESIGQTGKEEQELSEEEKQKIAQAQRYFEQGEKLVNNSYKKDYIQAYEYFKLAADLGHSKALEYLGLGHLLGDYISLDPEKALKIFTELTVKGSPRGQLGLGFCYGSGLAVNSSQAKALIYFTFAALGGDPLAQMVLGYRYLSGIGVESKCETALQFYKKVATTVAEQTTSGSPVIQRIRLHEQADNKDNGVSLMDADLLQYYEFLADKGDLQAQVVLGQLYYQGGRGVPINHERAHHYFLMASESGNANALAFLGKMHSEGSPYIKQDNLTAYQYFKKAGDKGNPIGLCGMGIMHFHGRGVEKDYTKALRYFSQSADQGWSDGQLQLGLMHYSGRGVKRDYKQAVRYLNLASQGGHVLAFFHLAQMHASGVGVMRNCHTAVEITGVFPGDSPGDGRKFQEFFLQPGDLASLVMTLSLTNLFVQLYKNVAERGSWAGMLMEAHHLYKEGSVNEALLKYTFLAELGYEVAQTNVAYVLDQGESSLFAEKETYQRALLQWTRAASQGSTMARLKMGDYHYYGYGTEIDYETAASHYRMATEQQHNAQAMFNLGYMHEQGLGLKQDVHLAKRFYDMAAETSGDAYVPVTLALVKLGVLYGFDVFNKELEGYNNVFKRLDIRYQLGPNWDIYLATFLAIVLGIVVVIRRQR